MDILTLISLVSGIMGIVGVIVQFLIDKDKIVLIGKNPNIRKAIKFFILGCFTFAIYGYLIYPAIKIYHWQPSGSAPSNPEEGKSIRLQQTPGSASFRTTTYEEKTLFFDDVFPTALAILEVDNQKVYLAGTYGAGLFVSTQAPYWEFTGLDNLVITEIVINQDNPSLIWVATNLGVAFSDDNGASWTMTGPVNDLVTDLASDPLDPMKLFAATMNGLYLSLNGGVTWVGPDLEGDVITSVRIAESNSNRIYASSLHSKLYRSDNAGETWIVIREPDEFGSAPLEIDPENPDIVYIGPSNLGLFRSTNAGESWEFLGLKGTSISSILITSLPQKTISIGTDQDRGVYVSKDDGKTWQNSGDLTDSVVAMINDTDTPGLILISTKRSGVLITRDFGKSWFSMGLASFSVITDFSPNSLLIRGSNADDLIASSFFSKGLYTSDDSGSSWSPLIGNSDLLRYSVKQILVDPRNKNHLVVSTYGGNVLESSNNGGSWKNITSNLPLGGYAPLALSENGDLFAGPSDQGIWKKSPNDELWIPTGLIGYSIESILIGMHSTSIYALDNGGVLHVSSDGGVSWMEPPSSFRSIAIRPSDETLIGISYDFEVVMSTDAGQSWRNIQKLTPSAQSVATSMLIDDETATLYISYDKVLLRSRNLGITWDELELPEYGEIQVAYRNKIYFLGDQALYISLDFGQTFEPVKYQSLIASSTQQMELTPGVFLLGTVENGIFASFDNLESWSETTVGLGKNVLALTRVDGSDNSVVALLANYDGVEIATSADGKLWSVNPTPCKSFAFTASYYGYSSDYFGEITNGDEVIWQLECSDPNGILVIKPNSYEDALFFSTADLKLLVSDALLMPDDSMYVLGTYQNSAQVYRTSNFGKKWESYGGFNAYYDWELNDDSRSDGVLIMKEGDLFRASWFPRQSIPIVVYLALVFSITLCAVMAFLPKLFEELVKNTKWLVSCFVKNPSTRGEKVSPYFLAIVSPIIVLLSILFFQIVPQVNTLSSVVSYQNFDEVVHFIASALVISKWSLFTVDGAVFVGILLAYSLIIATVTLTLALSISSSDIRKFISVWLDSLGSGFSLFSIGIPVAYILSALLNQFPDAFTQKIFGWSLLGIVNLWFVFLWYRILAIVLYRISDRYEKSIKAMTPYLIIACILYSVSLQIGLIVLGPIFAPEIQPVLQSIPVIPVGFMTGFLILVHAVYAADYVVQPISIPAVPPRNRRKGVSKKAHKPTN